MSAHAGTPSRAATAASAVALAATRKRVMAANGTLPWIARLSAALAAACTAIREPLIRARSESKRVVFMRYLSVSNGSPTHVHVELASGELLQHLLQALCARLRALGALNPSHVVVPLVRRARTVSLHQSASVERATYRSRH